MLRLSILGPPCLERNHTLLSVFRIILGGGCIRLVFLKWPKKARTLTNLSPKVRDSLLCHQTWSFNRLFPAGPWHLKPSTIRSTELQSSNLSKAGFPMFATIIRQELYHPPNWTISLSGTEFYPNSNGDRTVGPGSLVEPKQDSVLRSLTDWRYEFFVLSEPNSAIQLECERAPLSTNH